MELPAGVRFRVWMFYHREAGVTFNFRSVDVSLLYPILF